MTARWHWQWAAPLLLAAFSAQAAEPLKPDAAAGQRFYEQRCAICHAAPGVGFLLLSQRSGPGQADLAQRGAMPDVLVRTVVRRGIGLMPPFSKVAVSDGELSAIAGYLGRSLKEPAR